MASSLGATYEVIHDVVDQGGGRSASIRYSAATSVGGVGNLLQNSGGTVHVRNGFAAQLNSPPTTGAIVLERTQGRTVKLAVADLLNSAADPDLDAIELGSVAIESAQGGTVEMDGGWIIYFPPDGYHGADAFGYVIHDDQDGVSLGTVTVTVIPRDDSPTSNVLSIAVAGDGAATVAFIGIPGRAYAIEAAPSLDPPVWTRLTVVAAQPNGVFGYVDTDAPGFPQRYYRAVAP